MVWSPQPPGAVTVVTASRGRRRGSPRFHCCGKGGSGDSAWRCLENARTHSSKMGLSPTPLLLFFLLPDHKAKGTPSWCMWGQQVSDVPSRTLRGPLKDPWRRRPQVRQIPPVSSGKTYRKTMTLPALFRTLPPPHVPTLIGFYKQEKLRPRDHFKWHSEQGQGTTLGSTPDLLKS